MWCNIIIASQPDLERLHMDDCMHNCDDTTWLAWDVIQAECHLTSEI